MIPLGGVSETLLIPLAQRYLESQREDAIVRDERAADVVAALGLDVTRFESRAGQVGVAVRTAIVDRLVRAFLAAHRAPVVVNLGAGLCTRFERMGARHVDWFEVDLPAVAALRARVLPESKRHFNVASSVLNPLWVKTVKARAGGRPTLFVAEGLLMYLDEDEVHRVLALIAYEFPGAELAIEAMSPLMARATRLHPTVSRTQAEFRWGTWSTRALAHWRLGLEPIAEHYHADESPERWGWMQYAAIIPWVRRLFMIGHLRVASAA
jgi:O-methyltransferase involved in polyketide biosynthesis